MARYTEASCRQCRREGMKLYLKGERCYSKDKCAFDKRPTPSVAARSAEPNCLNTACSSVKKTEGQENLRRPENSSATTLIWPKNRRASQGKTC